MRRRTVLRAGVAGLAGAVSTGCATGGRATQVAVVWSGDELAQFRGVVRAYPEPVDVIGVGDDIDAFLRARHLAGTSPDVAMLPRPGLVTDYADRGWLTPLPDRLAARYPPNWNDQLRVRGALYGVWVKAAYKSLFWYRPGTLTAPRTWEDLTEFVRTAGAAGGPAPLAVGAADGWVLTDWFENLLAATDPGLYEQLAGGAANWSADPVRAALLMLADVWSLPGAFPGGGRRALLTQYEQSVLEVTGGQALAVFEGDFVEGVADRFLPADAKPLTTFRFPTVGGVQPVVVSGDAAVVLHGSARGQALVEWLTRPEVFRPWIESGGYLSPNRDVPLDWYPPNLRWQLAHDLFGADVHFDLSDRLPGSFGGADGVGSWRILQDFFAAVARPGGDAASRDAAAVKTMRALDAAARDPRSGL